jgi:hemoglobin
MEPQRDAPATPYDQLGGEGAVRRLVDRFYDLMDSAPEAAEIRRLHAASLRQSREKLYLFLSGWLGGPPLYVERYGHPMLRARHLPFPIGERERDQWMWCMRRALADTPMVDELRTFLDQRFTAIADHMRNQAPG